MDLDRMRTLDADFLPNRRTVLALSAMTMVPATAAKAAQGVLVIAMDIGDAITMDPARMGTYSPALPLHTAYETLVTMDPGDYVTIKPLLAASFARTPDDKGWRFKLRDGLKFASGNPITAADVKFSFDRMLNIKDQPAGYARTIARVETIDTLTVDIFTKDPDDPVLTILCAPAASILDSKLLKQNGGTDAPDAREADKATPWLNGRSAGSGPYQIVSWERNNSIILQRNGNHWAGLPAYERIVIRHIPESGSQLLAVRRGDVEVAFNLTPEQIKSIENDPDIRVARTASQDWVCISLTGSAEVHESLAKREARLAIAHAIDYDGIIGSLVGGAATRPTNYISVGIGGSTEQQTKEIGYQQDLDKARALLRQAGLPDGFSFPLQYPNGAFGGVPYQLLAQKVQSDLARVGIKAELRPTDSVTLRTQFVAGRSAAFFNYWNPPAVEPLLNAEAVFLRGAQRVKWNIAPQVGEFAMAASRARDQKEQFALYRKFTEAVQNEGHFIILFQPFFQVAVRKNVSQFVLTGAGWFAELGKAKPGA